MADLRTAMAGLFHLCAREFLHLVKRNHYIRVMHIFDDNVHINQREFDLSGDVFGYT